MNKIKNSFDEGIVPKVRAGEFDFSGTFGTFLPVYQISKRLFLIFSGRILISRVFG